MALVLITVMYKPSALILTKASSVSVMLDTKETELTAVSVGRVVKY